jgi:two-component system sensor histidine kinase RegB
VGQRRPGVLYGIGNLVENAADFARETVEIKAVWTEREVVITISDDGPGISPLVLDALGEPYITTRPARQSERAGDRSKDGKPHGMGLGFFIAKTLLERSGATVSLDNRPAPATGAVAEIVWPRPVFESRQNGHNGAQPEGQAGFGRVLTGQDAPS